MLFLIQVFDMRVLIAIAKTVPLLELEKRMSVRLPREALVQRGLLTEDEDINPSAPHSNNTEGKLYTCYSLDVKRVFMHRVG